MLERSDDLSITARKPSRKNGPLITYFLKEPIESLGEIIPLTLNYCQVTKFAPSQIEGVCRQQFQIWVKWMELYGYGQKEKKKTSRENEKLLVTSNFSFSLDFFSPKKY